MGTWQKPAIRITVIFLLISSCWIVFSDMLLAAISPGLGLNEHTGQTVKGLVYILIISLLIYFGIKKSSEELQTSFEEYKALFDKHPAPMWIFDTNLKFVRVNRAAILKYGYSASEFLSMSIKDIRPKEDIDKLHRQMETVQPGFNEAGIWRHIKKNGEVIQVQIAMHDVTYENKKCMLVVAADLTELLETQEQLQASQLSLSIIINNTKDLIWSFDRNLKLTGFNEPFAQGVKNLTGVEVFKGQEILAEARVNEVIHEWVPNYQRALEGEYFSTLHSGPRPDGSMYYHEVTFNPIVGKQGDVTGVVCFSRDITEKQTNEEKIKHQNEVLKEIAFTNSHVVRRPLSNLLGLTDMLTEEGLYDSTAKQVVESIKISALELDGIIKDIARKAYALKENKD